MEPSDRPTPAGPPPTAAPPPTVPRESTRTQLRPPSLRSDTAALAPPERADEIGRLAQYRVIRQLGAGGMGVVYEAEDTSLLRRVALKVMRDSTGDSAFARERFLREARAAAAIKHDHVVTVYQVGEDGGVPFIAMEFLKGQPLDSWLSKNPRPGPALVLQIGRQVALGLAAAHELGLVHRDIKPANVWLEAPKGRVKILDFGLARGAADVGLTWAGEVVGTPAYMSPEQARGLAVDARTDLFSLGVVLYRMATGEPPFKGPDAMAILTALAVDAPVPVREGNPDASPALADLVHRLLCKDPAGRPPSAKAVAEELRRMKDVPPPAGPSYRLPSRPTHEMGRTKGLPAESGRTSAAATDSLDFDLHAPDDTRPMSHPSAIRPKGSPWVRALTCLLLGAGAVGLLSYAAYYAYRSAAEKGPERNPTPGGNTPIASQTIESEPTPPLPGQEVEFEIADGLRMRFCWVPPGKARLGSPKTEKERSGDEAEHEYASRGFWLGKYHVTQGEWKAVTGTNPSEFDGAKDNQARGLYASRFPVENVSWDDTRGFLETLNGKGGAARAFGTSGKFCLPHEDEWEYACRGGKGNGRAYYFGDVLDGGRANCDGNYPYGTTEKGPFLWRTSEVGSYAEAAPHPWGLCDMAGNVWDWCENKYEQSKDSRVRRGGSWYNGAGYCRSASRFGGAPGSRYGFIGCRVCCRLD